MTLCLAWKTDNKISFASDSRAKVGSNNFDNCVKVSPIPITLKIISEDKSEDLSYNCGIAIAGSTLTAFSLISNICQVLRRMSILKDFGDFSMDHVCNIIQQYFHKLSIEAAKILFDKGQVAFFFCGYCYSTKKVRCFKFSPKFDGNKFDYSYEEILKGNTDIEFIGSGKSDAEKYQKSEIRPLYILRKVINDDNVDTVGGPIQYGRTNDLFFNTLGIIDYQINEKDMTYYPQYYFNGFELIDDVRMLKADSFHIDMQYEDPFKDLVNELNKKSYKAISNPNAT